MPYYDYCCEVCDCVTEVSHSFEADITQFKCIVCGEVGTLKRLPPTSINVSHQTNVGNLVKDFIEQNKELNKEEKEKLKRQEFKK
jgi:hypothetical protein